MTTPTQENASQASGMPPCSDLLTRPEAASYAGVSQRTISRWADERRIQRYSLGGQRLNRYSRNELDALVQRVEIA